MDPISTTLGALVAGLVTSVHCVGMCGPIACGLAAAPTSETERLIAMTSYHGARLTAYAVIGGICGAIGQQPLEWVFNSPAVLLPWVLVLVFLIFGFGLERKIPRPAFVMKWATRARFRLGRMSPIRSGLALGFLTPLLPCGPLYLLFAATLLTGSALKGAEFALAFGVGTVPLLWLAQHQLKFLKKKISPMALVRVQRGLAIVAALMIAFRLWGTIPFVSHSHVGDSPQEGEKTNLPSCCH